MVCVPGVGEISTLGTSGSPIEEGLTNGNCPLPSMTSGRRLSSEGGQWWPSRCVALSSVPNTKKEKKKRCYFQVSGLKEKRNNVLIS